MAVVPIKITKQAFCSPSLVRYYNPSTYTYELRYRIRRGNIITTQTNIAPLDYSEPGWSDSKSNRRTISKQTVGYKSARVDITTRDRDVPVDDYFEVW